MNNIILYTDGGARGNPGPAAAAAVIQTAQGDTLEQVGQYLGIATNNQAEYQALILGLTQISQMYEPSEVSLVCYLDSELVVKQMQGSYKVKEPGLKLLFDEAQTSAKNFGQIKFEHVRREKNALADALVNSTLDMQIS